jgi:hypothetical protein
MSRNDGKTDKSADKAGAEDQRPDALAKGDNEALDDVQKAVDVETEQGFRGNRVDTTPEEHYSATGDASKTPEAQADPVAARRDASNQ